MALRVYRIPFSTNVERVALAAGHKGLAIEWVDVDPDDRSVLQQLSGQSLVPVLVDGDDRVSDSPVIVPLLGGGDAVVFDWPVIVALLEARPPDPPLFPADEARRAEVELFIDWFNR